jgi:hypothetical protein
MNRKLENPALEEFAPLELKKATDAIAGIGHPTKNVRLDSAPNLQNRVGFLPLPVY